VLPLLYSATGHVFLSFVPEVETDPLLERELSDGGMTRAEVDVIKARVRAEGRACVKGTVIPGLRADAFPIFDLQGRAILSATALVPGAFKSDDSGAVLEKLATACRYVSGKLGWSN
jgi:DNA-binding IclR family transcriptional regulator